MSRFLAVQLQDIRPQRLDDIFERRIVGIDGERHLYRPTLGLLAEFARHLQAEMPRRWRKEHEAHHVRTSLQRDVERLARGQAADFDKQGHGLSGSRFSVAGNRSNLARRGGFYNVAPCLSRPAGP
jgi:hypothetical protein